MAGDDEPAWLSAWRGADAGRQPAQPAAQQRSQGEHRGSSGTSSAASTTAAAAQLGITEPQPWRFDQCKRRAEVLDHDYWPPRVVRRVGWNLCLRCVRPFFSEDVARLRMCNRCKGLTQEKPIGD